MRFGLVVVRRCPVLSKLSRDPPHSGSQPNYRQLKRAEILTAPTILAFSPHPGHPSDVRAPVESLNLGYCPRGSGGSSTTGAVLR